MAMHGFSTNGKGDGAGPVGYFVAGEYFAKSVDENGKGVGEWRPRKPLPEVIEGDRALMVTMIDAVPSKHKYTSGVLSFSVDDTLKLKALGLDEAIQDITARLKEMLFAGISEEHQHVLIVAHTHLGRLELHYVTPRWNYEVDRAFNPAPPGKAKFESMDALTDLINVKYGLDDPRDPLRARVTKDPLWVPNNEPTREAMNAFFTHAVGNGLLQNRDELIQFAKNSGFIITRAGSDYISVKLPGSEKAVRLKGEIYNERFTSSAELADTKTKSEKRAAYLATPSVVRRYKNAISERREFVEKRFAKIHKTVRSGKVYEETRSFYTTSSSKTIEVSKNYTSRMYNNNANKLSDKVVLNDGFRNEVDTLIRTSERRINNTKQSTSRADNSIRSASLVVQRAASTTKHGSSLVAALRTATQYMSIPLSPAELAGSRGGPGVSPDPGHSEDGLITNTKRDETAAMSLRHRAKFRVEADGEQYKLIPTSPAEILNPIQSNKKQTLVYLSKSKKTQKIESPKLC